MNAPLSQVPPIPDKPTVDELAAFVGFEATARVCQTRGYVLIIRIQGKLVRRCVTWKLYRNSKNHKQSRSWVEVGVWWVNERVWTRIHRPPAQCDSPQQATLLICQAMDDGEVQATHKPRAKPASKVGKPHRHCDPSRVKTDAHLYHD